MKEVQEAGLGNPLVWAHSWRGSKPSVQVSELARASRSREQLSWSSQREGLKGGLDLSGFPKTSGLTAVQMSGWWLVLG